MIPALIPFPQSRRIGRNQIFLQTDHGKPAAAVGKKQRQHFVPQIVLAAAPLVLFLQDHIALDVHFLGNERQAVHALGFNLHDLFEVVFRNPDVIDRLILAGPGVGLAAEAGDMIGKGSLALADAVGRRAFALEHHVLEKMRQPCCSLVFIAAADTVPQLLNDDGRAVVFDHRQGQAVGQRGQGGGRLTREGRRLVAGDSGGQNERGENTAIIEGCTPSFLRVIDQLFKSGFPWYWPPKVILRKLFSRLETAMPLRSMAGRIGVLALRIA